MIRGIFVFLAVAFVSIATLEFIGFVPEPFGSVGKLNDLVSLLALVSVVISFVAIARSQGVYRFLRRPLKREYKRTMKILNVNADEAKPAFFSKLIAELCAPEGSGHATPAQLVSAARQSSPQDTEWPWHLRELATWARNSENGLRTNIFLRFLLSERLSVISARLNALHEYAAGFPVAPPSLNVDAAHTTFTQHSSRELTRMLVSEVEGLTGASVLATGLHTRNGVDAVRLWHSDSVSVGGEQTNQNYVKQHLGSIDGESGAVSDCPWEKLMKKSSSYLIGDRDRHVPIVDGVTLSENRWAGTMEFVLSTHSSCMAATDHAPYACKGPAENLLTGTEKQPLWVEKERIVTRNYAEDNLLESNLAVHVPIIITEENGDRFLVLIRRGNTNLFGNQMLTVPGETLALSAGGHRGHTDTFGSPDLVKYAMSAARNTLGLELEESRLRPSHVFMVNQRESLVSATEGRSQLVCTVGYVTSVAISRKELEVKRVETRRIGRNGIQELIFLPFGKANSPDDNREHDVITLLASMHEHRSSMDQMSTTAALIIAARILGTTHVSKSLQEGRMLPWWNTSWKNEKTTASRLAVDLETSRTIQRLPEVPTNRSSDRRKTTQVR